METRKTITREVEYISPYDLEGKLGDVISYFQALIDRHGRNAGIYFGKSDLFSVFATRTETDEEYARRVSDEKRICDEHEHERRERATLKELLEKYGTPN